MDWAKYKRLTIDKLNYDGLMNLLEQFVISIRNDFISAYVSMMDNITDEKTCESYYKMKEYICSKYFCQLTGLDGKKVVEQLESDCAQLDVEAYLNGEISEDC